MPPMVVASLVMRPIPQVNCVDKATQERIDLRGVGSFTDGYTARRTGHDTGA